MKKIIFGTLFSLALLTSCGSSTEHSIVAKDSFSVNDASFTRYEVNNQYSIAVPSFLEHKPNDPDRFSFEYSYTDVSNLDNTLAWGVQVESDDAEAYEARRNKQGNLDKSPFTLEGFHKVSFSNLDPNHKLVGESKSDTIDGMPALVQEVQKTLDLIVAKATIHGYTVSIQGKDGRLYRINIYQPLGSSQATAAEIYKSFKQPIK